MEAGNKQLRDIDDWLELMFEAKQAGITIEKVKAFIHQHNHFLQGTLCSSIIRATSKNEPLI